MIKDIDTFKNNIKLQINKICAYYDTSINGRIVNTLKNLDTQNTNIDDETEPSLPLSSSVKISDKTDLVQVSDIKEIGVRMRVNPAYSAIMPSYVDIICTQIHKELTHNICNTILENIRHIYRNNAVLFVTQPDDIAKSIIDAIYRYNQEHTKQANRIIISRRIYSSLLLCTLHNVLVQCAKDDNSGFTQVGTICGVEIIVNDTSTIDDIIITHVDTSDITYPCQTMVNNEPLIDTFCFVVYDVDIHFDFENSTQIVKYTYSINNHDIDMNLYSILSVNQA